VPISTAFVFTPAIMVAFVPGPAIGVDDDADAGRIIVVSMRMPAIAIIGTNDRGRSMAE